MLQFNAAVERTGFMPFIPLSGVQLCVKLFFCE